MRFGGFAALQHSMELQLSESLRLNLANRAQAFETIILGGVQTDGLLASRAPLVRSVAALDAGPDPEATASLETSARGFLLLGFKQVRYLDHGNRVRRYMASTQHRKPTTRCSRLSN